MDVKEPVSVLFVCLGNICRSPLAEGLFLYHAEKAGTGVHFRVDSAGTSSEHRGELPDPRTRANAAQHGLNLTSHSRQVRVDDFNAFDWMFAMDRSNHRNLLRIRPAVHKARLHLLLGPELLTAPDQLEVPDPWYGGPEGFESVFQLLHGATERLHTFLCQHHGIHRETRS
ncbi:MAG: low molecular weight protein-tyrosine-phosphatase [Bacteroidota bacterium]|jgi:protein-tyrosine phosphatase